MVYWFIDLNHGYLVSIGGKYLFHLELRLFNFISTYVISGTNSTIFLLCLTTTVNGATPLDKLLIENCFWLAEYLFVSYLWHAIVSRSITKLTFTVCSFKPVIAEALVPGWVCFLTQTISSVVARFLIAFVGSYCGLKGMVTVSCPKARKYLE